MTRYNLIKIKKNNAYLLVPEGIKFSGEIFIAISSGNAVKLALLLILLHLGILVYDEHDV